MPKTVKTESENIIADSEDLLQCSIYTPGGNVLPRILLNNDCMVEIFKRMQTNDLILFSCLCEHCSDLIRERVFPQRNINIDEVFKLFKIREIFAYFGSNISDLTIHRRHIENKSSSEVSESQRLIDMLTRHCTSESLRKLDITLNFHDIDAMCIGKFSKKLQNLRDLTITASHYCSNKRSMNHPNENNHQIEILLQNTGKLRTIRINMLSISGEFLYRTPIKHLTELAFVQCEIQADALIESAAHFKCLTKFVWENSKFNGVPSVSENISTVCDILGREFVTIQTVTVHMNYGLKYCHRNGDRSVLDGLCRIPNLKHLSIGLAGACACNNFYGVIEKLQQLKSFTIESPLVFAVRSCLPCDKVIGNYLPKIFDKLRDLTFFRIVHINPCQSEHLFTGIINNLTQIDELHLIEIRQFNGENLLSLVQNISKLKVLMLQETRFNFTSELYVKLLNECQTNKRHVKIVVSQNFRRKLLAALENQYHKEFVQITAE